MNKQQLYQWIDDPATLPGEGANELQSLVLDYPYFQSARMLQLLNLRKARDYRFEAEVRKVAAYVPDRARLRDWIEYIDSPGTSSFKKEQKEDLPPEPDISSAVTTRLRNIEEQIRESLLELEEKKKHLQELIEEKKTIASISATHSEEIPAQVKKSVLRPLPKDDLLEEFIRQAGNQGFKRAAFYNPEESARKSIEENEGIVSETLARLIAAQGKKEKAIEIYQKLMLKNPQKSSYFAAQIEKLKKES
jgi:flagellar motility protein MotE (MotC chaperone)